MKTFSIKTKLLLLISLLLLPYLLFNIFTYIRLEKQIEINAMHYSEQLVQQLNSRLDTYFKDLERSSLPVIVHPLVQQLMNVSTEKEEYQYILLSERIREEVIPAVIFDRPEIYGFKIVSDQGAAVGNFRGPQNGLAGVNSKWDDIPNNQFTILGVHYLESAPILTVARKFWSVPSYLHAGLLVFELRLNHLTQHFAEVELGPSALLQVIDANQQIVFHSGQELAGQFLESTALPGSNGLHTGSVIKRDDNNAKRIVSFDQSKQTGLTVISEVPFADLTADSSGRHLNMWIHLIFIAVIVLGVSSFSFSLTRSVSHLQRLMKKAEAGNLHVKAPDNRYDEIGRLNRSFNHMVGTIRHLIEVIHKKELREKEGIIKQREATLLAMQSQINPHFLYNTLEIINSYAIVQEVMPISRMATALGEMFRYSFNNQARVTLQEEMDHVGYYLEIQRERYPKLTIQQELDYEELQSVLAIRLVVQPLVENAFKHGYSKHSLKPDYIGIFGESCLDGYRITISDRGKGMAPQQVERLNELFRHTPDEQVQPHGIGLWNVHQRIRLTYGKPYGLTIIKSDEKGTDIALKLPFAGGGPTGHDQSGREQTQ
ncbi:cache domain-containing sensor histidine kinase [Paenibacillus senegalensis]|uniref:cache domain-containing sensor histidine kinase n=1 Tax=Paenibacillus senegalensis TaxID=1465766 RepID=UPI000287DA7D|nr:sensor histidine kinase [Paenibacillus senegalensis]